MTLAPDGALGGLPWAALPGDRDGTVLLDDYRLALVPHGPFLLGRLLEPRRPTADPGRVLAVGGVDHGPAAGTGRGYPPLPGTAEEVRRVLALAGDRPATVLTGAEAGPDRLARELAGVRQAHLATHGYFDEAAFRREQERVRRQRQAWAFTPGRTTEPVGLGVRSPLGFTGLALAGANQSAAGVLTGEAIADLPLEGLDLVVLSACETGLGVAIRDEGAAGLQRAFHLAGARNVVAGLWQVPDVPTLVLMERFYANLWDKDQPLPSAEALRQAQLFVRGHPEAVRQRGEDLRRRGFGKELPPLPGGGKVEVVARSPALWWAGFALSGPGD